MVPLFMISCSSDNDDITYENIGAVDGIWAFTAITSSVAIEGSNTSALIVEPLLNSALQYYVSRQEPSYYAFYDDNTFITYNNDEENISSTGEGTYTLSGNKLTLTYSTSTTESFEIITANESSLIIKKDYSSSLVYWGAEILGSYAGLSLGSATATITYTIATSSN